MVRRVLKTLVGVAVVVALVVGFTSLLVPAQAASGGGPCLCRDIYAPVQCSNGKIYPNLCVATCRKARNCVPTGDI
jgi:hypothetical protein